MRTARAGFTIVELLIVIVIIAVLAAITIVSYNGIQNRAQDSAVKADLKAAATKIEMAKAEGSVPAASQAALQSLVNVSKSSYQARAATSLLYCRTDAGYALVAQSKSRNAFVMENGTTRSIGTWGGSNDNNACGANATVGLVWASEPGYGYYAIYNNSTWAW